ncbi:polysaccharide deacetylase family protein [Proteinivorax tanatarense]|uniref:Polysaccharide deacetylase family protein n=1 Tax=Proteinivorax tanatarense TaxID=1260629 RepID=A0AAU7VMN0_9FIRM
MGKNLGYKSRESRKEIYKNKRSRARKKQVGRILFVGVIALFLIFISGSYFLVADEIHQGGWNKEELKEKKNETKNTDNQELNERKEEKDKTDEKKEQVNDEKEEVDAEKEADNKDEKSNQGDKNNKVVYLTFDDGPSRNVTEPILDILDEYDVKGTFFVLGRQVEYYPNITKRIHDEGHLVANHTYSHDYASLYDEGNMIAELKKTDEIIRDVLGKLPSNLIRFPGGSFGKKRELYRQEVKQNGYNFVDWNVVNGDGEGKNYSKEELVERVHETHNNQNHAVVLMHDSAAQQNTAKALPEIIEFYKEEGYSFKTLENFG